MGKIIKADGGGKGKPGFDGEDRRKSARRPILESFGFFVAVPAKGYHRLPVHDVSEHGVGFDLDVEGTGDEGFPLKEGEALEIHLYLNQSLYIPLTVKAVRISKSDKKGRSIGAEFQKLSGASMRALQALVKMLDSLSEIGKIAS